MKNKKEVSKIFYITLRYLVLLLIAFPNLYLFYFVFTPLTIYPVYFLLKLFFNVSLNASIIEFNSYAIEIVKACVAGSAYYLLLILNFTTPMKLKTRIFSLLFSFSSFLLLNILRIFAFSILFIESFYFFNALHLFFWYVVSSLLVFIIWLLNIKLFKIKNIPFYADLSFLYKKAKPRKPKLK